jgi:hypothetical protein
MNLLIQRIFRSPKHIIEEDYMLCRKGCNVSILALTAFIFSALLCIGNQSFATMITQSLDELTVNSSHIVRGQVLAVESKWNESETSIYTQVTIQVAEVYKSSGDAPTTATVIFPGGTVDDTRLWVEHTPTFTVGQDVVTFLIDHGGFFDVTSWVQGKYTVENETVSELGSTATHFIKQINEVVASERQRNGEK